MPASTANRELPKRSFLAAAIVAAIAASSCCIGPLALAALGIGGASLFSSVAAWRPAMLAVTAGLLGAALYLGYRKPEAVAGGCGCARRPHASRVVLWIATVTTVLLAASAPLLARLSVGATAGVRIGSAETAVVRVRGVDCDACLGPIRTALTARGGLDEVRLDVAAKTVTVSYAPGPDRPAVYVEAIDALGYEASLVEVR